MEFVDDRLGPHLFVSDVAGGVPLIISGARGDIAAGVSSALNSVKDGGTLGASASAVPSVGGAFDQKFVDVLENVTIEGQPVRVGPLSFLLRAKEGARSAFSTVEDLDRRAFDLWDGPFDLDDRPPPPSEIRGIEFWAAFVAAFKLTDGGDGLNIFVEYLELEEEREFQVREVEQPSEVPAKGSGSITIPFSEDGTATAIVDLSPALDLNRIDDIELPVTLGCLESVLLNGTLTIRTTVGPITTEWATQLLDPNTPPADCCSGVPQMEAEIYEEQFLFENVPCEPESTVTLSAVVNSASNAFGDVTEEMIVASYGVNLASETVVAGPPPLPTTLADTMFTITDSQAIERDMGLYFVSSGQANGVIPPGTALGPGVVTVKNLLTGAKGTEVQDQSWGINVTAIAPGIFSADSSGQGTAAALVLIVKPDQSRVTTAIFDGTFAPIPIVVDGPDLVYLLLFGTGIRDFSSQVTVQVGGEGVPVLGAVTQGQFPGLDQVNAGPLPASLAGRGEVSIDVTVDGVPANVTTATIE